MYTSENRNKSMSGNKDNMICSQNNPDKMGLLSVLTVYMCILIARYNKSCNSLL